jgi:hypothetical protein
MSDIAAGPIGAVCGASVDSLGGAESSSWRSIMATGVTQQVVDYLKSHPDVAKKAMDYVKSHPGDMKNALKDVADQCGWDLSQVDTTALTQELGKFASH